MPHFSRIFGICQYSFFPPLTPYGRGHHKTYVPKYYVWTCRSDDPAVHPIHLLLVCHESRDGYLAASREHPGYERYFRWGQKTCVTGSDKFIVNFCSDTFYLCNDWGGFSNGTYPKMVPNLFFRNSISAVSDKVSC